MLLQMALFPFFFFTVWYFIVWGFPSGSEGKESASNEGDMGLIPGSDPWVRKIPWRREWQPTPVFLPGKVHGQRSLVGYSPWSHIAAPHLLYLFICHWAFRLFPHPGYVNMVLSMCWLLT